MLALSTIGCAVDRQLQLGLRSDHNNDLQPYLGQKLFPLVHPSLQRDAERETDDGMEELCN